MHAVSDEYLATLLRCFEEELAGEAYFYGLCEHFPNADQQRKLRLLAQVERHSAEAVRPLIEKYALVPRPVADLSATGATHVDSHKHWTWVELVTHMAEQYPRYLDEFEHLASLAPMQDQRLLSFLTQHEVAAIEFAQRELAGDADSASPLSCYLTEQSPRLENH